VKGNERKVCVVNGSPRVTIPPALTAQLGIEAGTIVRWTIRGQRLILEPVGYEEPKKRQWNDGFS